MPIPTELVGSLPRPMKLQGAYADYDEGKIGFHQLQAAQDEAAEDSIKRLEATGEPIVTGGEQRESSFATYNLTDTLASTGLADGLAGDRQSPVRAVQRRGAHEHRRPHLSRRRLRPVHSKEVPYELLLEHMFGMNAGYVLIQCASEEDRESVYKLCGKYSREDADGVAQVCFMGVINPLSPDVETPEQVCSEPVTAAKYIPAERLGATDDCGFSPFSRDVKPRHESPDFARDVAMQKISARLEGARRASEELGV